jgi:hypothetical protein
MGWVVYYESMNRKIKIKPIYECRCDGRLRWVGAKVGLFSNKPTFAPTPSLREDIYYESMKRKIKPINPKYECRCNGRLQAKRFTRLTHTGLVVELEHLKIETRLTNEKFASVKGKCEI